MSSQYYEIPLVPSVNQRFNVPLLGVTYRLFVHWAAKGAGVWLLDIADDQNNSLVAGIPLVPGADLLSPYAYLNIGGQLWVITDADPSEPPTFDNLGVSSHLYFVTGDVPNWSFT